MTTADMNLLDFFLILAFMGAMQSMFALLTSMIVLLITIRFHGRNTNHGR